MFDPCVCSLLIEHSVRKGVRFAPIHVGTQSRLGGVDRLCLGAYPTQLKNSTPYTVHSFYLFISRKLGQGPPVSAQCALHPDAKASLTPRPIMGKGKRSDEKAASIVYVLDSLEQRLRTLQKAAH